MARSPQDTDPVNWHRHFAAQANNRAWELAESRADDSRDDEMLATAHAAAWHWAAVGTELHCMRAAMLLALAEALAGHAPAAWRHAQAVRAFFVSRNDTPDWELALVHAIHALAAQVAGHADEHAASWAQAQHCIEAIADDEDRAIVLRTWALVPVPAGRA